MRKDFLRSTLAQESRAYGFTLAFWGSGALLINSFGVPSLPFILLYVLGALTGFGLLTIIAFKRAFSAVEYDEPEYLVFSMVHYISALAPILVTSVIIPFGREPAFFFAGFSVSTVYNLLMMFEERLTRQARDLERKLVKL